MPRTMKRLMIGSFGGRGFWRMMSGSPFSMPSASAGSPSVIRFNHSSWMGARGELLEYQADWLWNDTSEIDGACRVRDCFRERPFEETRQLALRLREHPRTVVLFATRDEKGLRLVCACSDDLEGRAHAGELLRTAAQALGGRGGGSASVAQGGAPDQPCERVFEVFDQILGGLSLL